MKLCTPELKGPVSAWSTVLVIRQAVPGAEVVVAEGGPGGTAVFKGVASAFVFRAPLPPGAALTPGAKLFLYQQSGTGSSEWTDAAFAAEVGAAPTQTDQLPPFHCLSRLYPGGTAIALEGVFPGAEVVARAGGAELGRGAAVETRAFLRLSAPIPTGGMVEFTQSAPAGFPPLSGPPALPLAVPVLPPPVPPGAALPPLAFDDPVPAAGGAVFGVKGAVDGAVITLLRARDGSSADFDAYQDELLLLAVPPFACAGDAVAVSQRMASDREVLGSSPTEFAFGEPAQPRQPVPHRPCGGAGLLVVDGIENGAEVSIQIAAPGVWETYKGIGSASPFLPHRQTFQLPPIPAGARVRVWQTRCGLQSLYGETTADRVHATTMPVVAGPLLQCGWAVRVSRIEPESWVRVLARAPYGTIQLSGGWLFSETDTLQIEVTPHLHAGWDIIAEQLPCAGPSIFSQPVGVEPAPPVDGVGFARPPIATETSVAVKALPGALVEIHIGDASGPVIGRGIVDPEEDRVFLDRALVEGEVLFGRQTLCSSNEPRGGELATVQPAAKVFTLEKKKVWPVPSEDIGKDVVWKSATLTCRFAGDFTFAAELEIKAQKSSAVALVQVRVDMPAFLPFGDSYHVALVADNPAIQEDDVLREQEGYASPAKVLVTRPFTRFTDPFYWLALLTSQAKFSWVVTLRPLGGKSKISDGKEKKHPNEITLPHA